MELSGAFLTLIFLAMFRFIVYDSIPSEYQVKL